jgi:putative DNA primase/helicase
VGETFTASQKYAPEHTIRPVAGHLFLANKLPGTRDAGHAFFRRWSILQFNRKFEEHEKDKALAEHIIQTELAVVADWALQGLERLLTQRSYTIIPSGERAKEDWKKTSNNVALFVDEVCEPISDDASWTRFDELFQGYCEWCRKTGHKAVSNNVFGERLKALGHGSRQRRLDGAVKNACPLVFRPAPVSFRPWLMSR